MNLFTGQAARFHFYGGRKKKWFMQPGTCIIIDDEKPYFKKERRSWPASTR